ncbi:MAG: BON domain-containing protein [Nitrospira sp.]
MTKSPLALILLSVSVFLWGPAFSEAQEKDGGTETPAPRSQSSPAPSDSQPAPPKPSTDAKPPSQPNPPTKTDSSSEHKEGVPEKPATPKPSTDAKPPSQPNPPTKTDSSSEHKEGVPEKPATPKPSTDVKPQSKPSTPTKADSSSDHKEGVPEKHAPRTQHPPAASDGQSGPAKPSADAKSQSQSGPPAKADVPAAEPENKEKDPAAKKPLGSLILCVKLALMGDARLFRYDIEVGDDQQTVTLTGRVSTEEEKTASTEVAQGVQGVKAVVNKLAVEKDLAKTLLKKQDEILTTLIKERFSKSATLKAANFEVKTEDGVVQLNGSVRFQVIALEAAETARQVPGVRAVNTEKIRLESES